LDARAVVQLVTTPHALHGAFAARRVDDRRELRRDLGTHAIVVTGLDEAVRVAPFEIDVDVAPLPARVRARARPVDARAVALRLHPRLERLKVVVYAEIPRRLAKPRER